MTHSMTSRKIGDWAQLRGGPGWDYPCANAHITECASSHCQLAGRCRLTDYFALLNDGGEHVRSEGKK